jgi:hypothetical protein
MNQKPRTLNPRRFESLLPSPPLPDISACSCSCPVRGSGFLVSSGLVWRCLAPFGAKKIVLPGVPGRDRVTYVLTAPRPLLAFSLHPLSFLFKTCHFQSPYLSPTCHFKTPLSLNKYRPPVTLLPPHTPWVPFLRLLQLIHMSRTSQSVTHAVQQSLQLWPGTKGSFGNSCSFVVAFRAPRSALRVSPDACFS